jgi:PAS domain S-box-containing protein
MTIRPSDRPDPSDLPDPPDPSGPPEPSDLPDPSDPPDPSGPPEPSDLPDALPDALIALDAERRIAVINTATERLTGYPRDALVGRDGPALLDTRDGHGVRLAQDGWPRAAHRLRTVKALAEQIVLLRHRDGHDVRASITGVYRRDDNGAITGAVVSLRDADRRRPGSPDAPTGIEVVSTVSHELRSPLTSVKGYTSLLLNRWDRLEDDQKRMMLEQVNHDADRVTRLISELLDISRLETGRLVLHRQLVDLPRLAATVVEKVRLEYPELEAETHFPVELPKVYADPDKVEQVLTNLVENACKYGSPKGLRIDGSVDEGSVALAVTDHGEGIQASDLPKVFSKYFRRSVGRPTGSGLGLWISRGLVESHGGRLEARSNPGQGSTFRFTLPLLDLDRLQES